MACRVIRICRNRVTIPTVPGNNTEMVRQPAETIRRLRLACEAKSLPHRWNGHGDDRSAAGPVVDADGSVVGCDDFRDDRQSQAAAAAVA